MEHFHVQTMTWANPVPMQTVTEPEGHMAMPMYDQRAAFDTETFGG
jgi:hypothetical protein